MPQVIESRLTGGHLLKDATGRIEVTVYVDGTATATDNDPTTPTVTVTRANGTAVATAQATTKSAAGVYYYDLTPAICNRVDTLTVELSGTWSSGSQTFTHTVEVRGAHLFTLAQARAFDNADGSTGALNDATVYPVGRLLDERERITRLLEQWTGVSWVPRHARVTLPGTGGTRLSLPHRYVTELISATVGGVAITTTDVTIDTVPGVLIREAAAGWDAPTPSTPFNIVAEYEHGHEPWESGADRIALLLLRDRLVKSAIPDGAMSAVGEYGSISFVQPGGRMRNVSRVPEVNAWVAEHRLESPLGV